MDHTMDYGGYMPHGMCLLWEPWLVLLWAGSDLLIFLSYTAIPIALLRVLRRNANKEKEQNKPPRAYRELFRLLREIEEGAVTRVDELEGVGEE